MLLGVIEQICACPCVLSSLFCLVQPLRCGSPPGLRFTQSGGGAQRWDSPASSDEGRASSLPASSAWLHGASHKASAEAGDWHPET